MVIFKRLLLSFKCSPGEESQGHYARHLDVATEVLSGGLSQRGTYGAKKQKAKQPSGIILAKSTDTSDSSQFLPGPDLAHSISQNSVYM